ncbi:unnamed protein product [Parajaminaea phylloscopi]
MSLTTMTSETAYLTPATYQHLLAQTLALNENPSAMINYESRRAQACGLVAAVGAKLGLPQRTIDTAFTLWQKRAIQHGVQSGTAGQQLALSSLFLACKLNDTPKRARDLVLASLPLRYPELVKQQSSSVQDPRPKLREMSLAHIQDSDVDGHLLEAERAKMLSLERSLLDSIGFDLRIRHNVEAVSRSVLKLGRAWDLSKAFIKAAWKASSDLHRTPSPLVYLPVTLSLAALLAAALIGPAHAPASYEVSAARVKAIFGLADHDGYLDDLSDLGAGTVNGEDTGGDLGDVKRQARAWARDQIWESELRTYSEEVEEAVHHVLDLYLGSVQLVASQQQQHSKAQQQHLQSSSPSPASPLNTASISPASPSEYALGLSNKAASGSTATLRLPSYATNAPPLALVDLIHSHVSATQASVPAALGSLSNDFTMAKIALRQREDSRRALPSSAVNGGPRDDGTDHDSRDSFRQSKRIRRSQRRREIEREKTRVQVLRIQVAEKENADRDKQGDQVEKASGSSLLDLGTTIIVSAAAAAASARMNLPVSVARSNGVQDDVTGDTSSLPLRLLGAGLPLRSEAALDTERSTETASLAGATGGPTGTGPVVQGGPWGFTASSNDSARDSMHVEPSEARHGVFPEPNIRVATVPQTAPTAMLQSRATTATAATTRFLF